MADRTIIGYGGANASNYTPVSAANPLPVTSGTGSVATGASLGALNAYQQQTPGVNGTMLVQVTGTFVGTLSLLGTVDGTNWITFGATPQFLNLNTGAYTATITATGIYQTSVNSLVAARISMTAYTSGTAIVSTSITNAPAMVALDASLPAGANTIGAVTSSPNTGAATGGTLSSAATTNATSVKASPGNLFQFTVINTTASAAYVKWYNKASAPTVGTDLPVDTVTVPAAVSGVPGRFSEEYGVIGKRFGTGVALAITGAGTDADTTAVATGIRLHYTYA